MYDLKLDVYEGRWTAILARGYEHPEVRGCPLGRANSPQRAVADWVARTNAESKLAITLGDVDAVRSEPLIGYCPHCNMFMEIGDEDIEDRCCEECAG